jgi:hypothetical protein
MSLLLDRDSHVVSVFILSGSRPKGQTMMTEDVLFTAFCFMLQRFILHCI